VCAIEVRPHFSCRLPVSGLRDQPPLPKLPGALLVLCLAAVTSEDIQKLVAVRFIALYLLGTCQ
jgi:hypothetical protein